MSAAQAYSGYQIKTALDTKDAATLAGKIDFASVKESLRPAATAEAERTLKTQLSKAGSGAGVLGDEIAKKALPKLVDASLNSIVTPENIIRIYSEGGAMQDTVSRVVADQLGKSGGIPGLGSIGALTGGGAGTEKSGGLGSVIGNLGKAAGLDTGALGGLTGGGKSPVRTVEAPKPAANSGASGEASKPGFGISNIKRFGPSGPLSMELGVAKDPTAKEADITAEMSFTGTDWKLTGLRPKL